MSAAHILEYSKSSKAKCHGDPPCHGTPIELGALRYGQVSSTKYGETVQWRHWGCVTPTILRELAPLSLESIPGFKSLRSADQMKIRLAIARKKIDPADIPPSARSREREPAPITAQKRKADVLGSSHSYRENSVPDPLPSISAEKGREIYDVPDDNSDETDDEEATDELYCMMRTNVVGLQYYNGMVGPGEAVTLVREPHNRYDANAIQVKNISGHQVGHVPRAVAVRLAPLLDEGIVTVEGVIHDGNLGRSRRYTISMSLMIYGAANQRDALESLLIWATPGQRGFPPRGSSSSVPGTSASQGSLGVLGYTLSDPTSRSQAQEVLSLESLRKATVLRQILDNLEKVDDEGRRQSLLDELCSTEDVLNLPEHPTPPSIASGDLMVDLLKHQSQALQWCLDHEYPVLPSKEDDKPVQFWQFKKYGQKSYYHNVVTKTPQEAAPILGRGGLCGDSMGLGKTLTMLSLVLATKGDIPSGFSKATLIVTPLSILSNWETQIKEHCRRDALHYYIYYGTGRDISSDRLKKYDIVLTTYQMVTKDHELSPKLEFGPGPAKKQKRGKGLFDIKWKRVILDEGHTIRNPKTKVAKAVCGLEAERRWVVSGTPIINSPTDLGSLLTFLQICVPLNQADFFKSQLLRPLKRGDPAGVALLRALMNQICLRRTKEMEDKDGNRLVPLPPIEITMVPVTLDPETRELYNSIEELSRRQLRSYMAAHGGTAVPARFLGMLTRMRQVALHPGLIPSNYVEQLRTDFVEDDQTRKAIQITARDRIRLQGRLAQGIEDNEECPICFDIMNEPRITSCAHMFCLECITEVITRDAKCPMDRRQITMADLIEPAPFTDLTQIPANEDDDDAGDFLRTGSSAKIEQLVHLLRLTPFSEKSLVFSQFTSFLDKIADALDKENIPYVRFDGKLSQRKRQEALERFCVPVDEELELSSFQAAKGNAELLESLGLGLRKGKSRVVKVEDEDDEDTVTIDDSDDEFIPDKQNGGAGGNESEDSFLNDDYSNWNSSTKKEKGKGKAKATSKAHNRLMNSGLFSSSNENAVPKVMLISLKAGALGLNLTVANNVYLMDPWWQEGIESQAIDRCNRIGQKKSVHVYQLIAEDTIESKVLEIQERKKKLVNEAFSGAGNETQRNKKEARLQDLIHLFGLRQQEEDTPDAQPRQSTLDNVFDWNSD